MSYEKIMLSDGTAVLFATSDETQEPERTAADPSQSDPTRLVASLASESRGMARGEARMRREVA